LPDRKEPPDCGNDDGGIDDKDNEDAEGNQIFLIEILVGQDDFAYRTLQIPPAAVNGSCSACECEDKLITSAGNWWKAQ
jgi:hypothetical protein